MLQVDQKYLIAIRWVIDYDRDNLVNRVYIAHRQNNSVSNHIRPLLVKGLRARQTFYRLNNIASNIYYDWNNVQTLVARAKIFWCYFGRLVCIGWGPCVTIPQFSIWIGAWKRGEYTQDGSGCSWIKELSTAVAWRARTSDDKSNLSIPPLLVYQRFAIALVFPAAWLMT